MGTWIGTTLGYGFALGGYAGRRFRQELRVRRVVGKQLVVAHVIDTIGSCTILWTAFYVDNAHLIPRLKHLPALTCLRAAYRDRAAVPGGIPLPFCTENGQAHAIRYSFERRQMMAPIEGMERHRTLVARLAFFLSRRSYGRVITPARIYALDSGLLLAVGLMEEVQEWAQ